MALSAGIGIGSVVAGAISGDGIELGLVPAGSLMMSLCCMALGATTDFHATLAWLAGIGFAGGLFVVPLNAWLQEKAGAKEKGRILATNSFVNTLGIIVASATLWLLHDHAGWTPSSIFLALGAVMLAGTLAVCIIMPAVSVRFALFCVAKCLFRVRIEGADRVPMSGGALIVSNHVSWADAFLLGMTTPRIVRFLMWAPFYRWPGAHSVFALFHTIPVQAGSARTVASALAQARTELARGKLVGIFPEGHLTKTGEIAPFQRGFGRIVEGTGAPVFPMRIDGIFGHPLSAKGGNVCQSWEKLWRPEIRVRVGEPIYGAVSPEELRQVVTEMSWN
jgi:acyl-[acyl-carrier-protein]-phospholipid O-acyltransferase/long-chain-fatty-acid--[acyl-carrier-protein] ligase